MFKHLFNKNICSILSLVLCFSILLSNNPVNASVINKDEILSKYAEILIDSVTYNPELNKYEFHRDAASFLGLSSEETDLFGNYF